MPARVPALLSALALGLAGCGSDSDDEGDSGGSSRDKSTETAPGKNERDASKDPVGPGSDGHGGY